MSDAQHIVLSRHTRPFCFKWTIEKYNSFAEEKTITSEAFTTGGPTPRMWVMTLHPKGNSEECRSFLSLFLAYLPDEYGDDVTASWKFSIKSATNNDYSIGPFVKVYHSWPDGWGYSKFISIQELARSASDLLPNDTLTLICEGEVLLERKHEEVKVSTEVSGPQLSEDVQNALQSTLSKDVALVVNGSEIPVHKFILCVRSPVFAAMFEHDTDEKRTGKVIIKDLKPEVVRGLIHFMYSDQIPASMTDELTLELLAAADKYQVLRLKSMCECHLVKFVTVENVLHLLKCATLYNTPVLKDMCLKFVTSNVKEVKESKSWKECDDVDVLKVLLDLFDVQESLM